MLYWMLTVYEAVCYIPYVECVVKSAQQFCEVGAIIIPLFIREESEDQRNKVTHSKLYSQEVTESKVNSMSVFKA